MRPPTTHRPRRIAGDCTYPAMIEGATKIPDPMTLPTMSIVASSSPRPRTSGGASPPATGTEIVNSGSGAAEVLGRLGDGVLGRERQHLVEAPSGQTPDEGQRGNEEDPAQNGHPLPSASVGGLIPSTSMPAARHRFSPM